jgi:hypothetical protein
MVGSAAWCTLAGAPEGGQERPTVASRQGYFFCLFLQFITDVVILTNRLYKYHVKESLV